MPEILKKAPLPFRGTEVHTLDNGLRIILKTEQSVPVVALQVWARCGAIDEAPAVFGISHGLEHMVFKGTPTRSAGEISRTVEFHGGSINAATQLETTHYYIDIPSYGLTPALEILADTILNPTFPQDELERERLVILEEIHRRDDNPDATLWDEFISRVFKGTPYGTKVIGTEETVSSLSRQDLQKYFRDYYIPSNLVIVAAGAFDKKAVLKKMTSLFKNMPIRERPAKSVVEMNGFIPENFVIKKPVQLTYVAMGIPTVGLGHPDAVALDLLADVLGGGRSARLYSKLREEKQLVLGVSCDYVAFEQRGLFAIFAEAIPRNADQAIEAIMHEVDHLKTTAIQPAELSRAKARIKSDWLHGSETPHGQASTLGSLSVLGQLPLINHYLNQIDTLTIEDLMKTYERYITGNRLFVAKLEPEN